MHLRSDLRRRRPTTRSTTRTALALLVLAGAGATLGSSGLTPPLLAEASASGRALDLGAGAQAAGAAVDERAAAAERASRSAERAVLEQEEQRVREARAEDVAAAVAERQRLEAEQAAAAVAAAAAEAARAAEEAARRAALDAAVADPRSVARALAAERGWGEEQFGCLDDLWTRESGWKHTADNPTSSAYGIPQALPGAKMASAGADWEANPVTQITWGLGYIAEVYGTPCGAWAKSERVGWY